MADVKREAHERVSHTGSREEAGVESKDNSAYPPGQRPGAGSRAKSHCKKFWWIYLILFIVGALVVILPLIFVGFPNIAQKDVNKSTLDITSQKVTNPTSKSVDLEIVSSVTSTSKFHPTLDEFEGSLFLEDTLPDIKPFGTLKFPSLQVQAENTVNIKQTMQILDMDQFVKYNELVVNSEEFRVAVRGRTGLHQSGLKKIDVDYNKVITMKGLNKLSGFAIKSVKILQKPADDGSNLEGEVFIPNPSALTIEMGTVVLDLSVDGKPIGNSTISPLTLAPGDNTFKMSSTTDQSTVIGLVVSKYKNGIVPVDIVGRSSTNSKGERLEYFEAAIKANKLRADLDVSKAIGGS